MHFIETHAHLDDPRFACDLDAVLARAHAAGVSRIITIGTGMESNRAALALAERYPSVYAAVGVHPAYVREEGTSWKRELRSLAAHPKVVALGEMGLDYYHLPSDLSHSSLEKWREDQIIALQHQLDLAMELGLNVVVHQRDLPLSKKKEYPPESLLQDFDAWEEILKILHPYTGKVRAVFHCFGGTVRQASQILSLTQIFHADGDEETKRPGERRPVINPNDGCLYPDSPRKSSSSTQYSSDFPACSGDQHDISRLGHLISFTGMVTFKNASLVRETVRAVGSDHYMIETDSPYLAPTPHRGERAEPAHVRLVAEKIAELRGISLEEVAVTTTETAEHFFRFPKEVSIRVTNEN